MELEECHQQCEFDVHFFGVTAFSSRRISSAFLSALL